MAERVTTCELLESALESVQALIQRHDADCTILDPTGDDPVIIGTADGYLALARVILAFLLKAQCDRGPADVSLHEFRRRAERAYYTNDIGAAFTDMSPSGELVTPVCAFLADDEEHRRRIEEIFSM